jgi:hypothetical protein
MSKPGDKDSQPPPSKADLNEPPAADKRSGRIAYDDRGNSVWEWQLEPGVFSRDISTDRLKKLDLTELSIVDTAKHRRPPGLGDAPAKPPLPGGGFNPYDTSSTAAGNVGGNPYNSGGLPTHKADSKAAAPRKPMDLKKLEEWVAIRKRVQENKRDDDEDEQDGER